MFLIKSGYSRKSLSEEGRGNVEHNKDEIVELGRGQIKKEFIYKPSPVGSRSHGKSCPHMVRYSSRAHRKDVLEELGASSNWPKLADSVERLQSR